MLGDTVTIGEENDVKSTSIVEFIWNVENFKTLPTTILFASSIFHADATPEQKWKVYMHYIKEAEDAEANVKTCIKLIEAESVEGVTAECQLNYLDSINRIGDRRVFEDMKLYPGAGFMAMYPYREIINNPDALINGNTLRVHCKISTQTTTNPQRQLVEEDAFSVNNQLKSFILSGNFSDVVLKTANGSIPASKLILAGHSPVFRAMFGSGMRESTENLIKIDDFSAETVKDFLEFLYTGESISLKDNAVELLKIGDKYEVMNLKKKAEAVLLGNLNFKNAVEILIVAHFCSPTTLKPKVIDMFNFYRNKIKNTDAFKKMVNDYPQLVRDLSADFSSA